MVCFTIFSSASKDCDGKEAPVAKSLMSNHFCALISGLLRVNSQYLNCDRGKPPFLPIFSRF